MQKQDNYDIKEKQIIPYWQYEYRKHYYRIKEISSEKKILIKKERDGSVEGFKSLITRQKGSEMIEFVTTFTHNLEKQHIIYKLQDDPKSPNEWKDARIEKFVIVAFRHFLFRLIPLIWKATQALFCLKANYSLQVMSLTLHIDRVYR